MRRRLEKTTLISNGFNLRMKRLGAVLSISILTVAAVAGTLLAPRVQAQPTPKQLDVELEGVMPRTSDNTKPIKQVENPKPKNPVGQAIAELLNDPVRLRNLTVLITVMILFMALIVHWQKAQIQRAIKQALLLRKNSKMRVRKRAVSARKRLAKR